MAICQGATAMGYFTHVWKPAYLQFGVPPENRKALASINSQIGRLAPALLGDPPPRKVYIEADGKVKLDILARRRGETLFLFAVNYDEREIRAHATIRVEDMASGKSVQVVDEERKLESKDGFFVDTFAPLAVHVYRIEDPL